MPVSVNVGACSYSERILWIADCLLAHTRVPNLQLEIEVLETSALQDVVKAAQVLNAVSHRCGLHWTISYRYSSLTYLKRLPAAF